MKVLSYDTLAQNFPKTWATIESSGEEVIVTRNRRRVARIVPQPAPAGALDMFGDLHGALSEEAGARETRRHRPPPRAGQHVAGKPALRFPASGADLTIQPFHLSRRESSCP